MIKEINYYQDEIKDACTKLMEVQKEEEELNNKEKNLSNIKEIIENKEKKKIIRIYRFM